MHQARHGAMAVLAERIVGLAGRLEIFGADRDMRAAERLQRILARHQARIIRRDAERQRALMADHRVALVVGEHEDALELGERADARARLPAPVVPLGGIDLGIDSACGRRASSGPTGKRSMRTTTASSCGVACRRESIDRGMWFGEKLRCRLRATGRLFGLNLKQLHGICVPSKLSRTGLSDYRRLWSVKSASYFSDLFINFKSQERRAHNFFCRGVAAATDAVAAARLSRARSSTATKKPSVPWLRGVISSVSAEPSAEADRSQPWQGLLPKLRPGHELELGMAARESHPPGRGSPTAAPSR